METARIDDLVKQEQREYFRKWRAANRDKVAASNRRYWEKRARNKETPQDDKKTP